MAPGGGAALLVPNIRGAANGLLELYDASSGALLRTFPAPAGFRFLAMSPGGAALFYSAAAYRVVDLGRKFADEPVVGPVIPAWPFVFFAAQ